jgi:hypothetical protein
MDACVYTHNFGLFVSLCLATSRSKESPTENDLMAKSCFRSLIICVLTWLCTCTLKMILPQTPPVPCMYIVPLLLVCPFPEPKPGLSRVKRRQDMTLIISSPNHTHARCIFAKSTKHHLFLTTPRSTEISSNFPPSAGRPSSSALSM